MLDLIRHNDILELRLARPPVNAFDLPLTHALREAITAPEAGVRGIVLSGRVGMFSGGLDVAAVLQLDQAGRIADSDRRSAYRTFSSRGRGAGDFLRLPHNGTRRIPHRTQRNPGWPHGA